MKTYKELNLRSIRDAVGLDFAHFTYKRGMCSCCYGPVDLPKRYWAKKVIPTDNNYTYLLFKNADNGRGHVTRNDYIKDYTCIEWNFPMELMPRVCELLAEQLGDDYKVETPKGEWECIVIRTMRR